MGACRRSAFTVRKQPDGGAAGVDEAPATASLRVAREAGSAWSRKAGSAFGGEGDEEAFRVPGAAAANGVGHQLGVQAAAVGVVALWSAVLTFVLAKAAALAVPMRASPEEEHDGLDLSHHGERAYEFD